MALDEDESARVRRLLALGQVTERAAALESTLRAIVGALIGTPRAVIVVSGQNVSWLVENALAIIKHNDQVRGPDLGAPEDVAEFAAAIKRCGELNKRRNDVLHAPWVADGVTQIISKYRQPLPIAIQTPLADLEQLRDGLAEAEIALLTASKKVRGIISGT